MVSVLCMWIARHSWWKCEDTALNTGTIRLNVEQKGWLLFWALLMLWTLLWPYGTFIDAGRTFEGRALLTSVTNQEINLPIVVLQGLAITIACGAGFLLQPGRLTTRVRWFAIAWFLLGAMALFKIEKTQFADYSLLLILWALGAVIAVLLLVGEHFETRAAVEVDHDNGGMPSTQLPDTPPRV